MRGDLLCAVRHGFGGDHGDGSQRHLYLHEVGKQNALEGGAYGMSVLSYNGAVCHCYYDELDEKYGGLIHLGPYTSNAEGSTFAELEQDFHRVVDAMKEIKK